MILNVNEVYKGNVGTNVREYLARNALKEYSNINHEEYSYKGNIWTAHWESKSSRFNVPEAGWVVYVRKSSS